MSVSLAIAAVFAIIYGVGDRLNLVDIPPDASLRRFLLGIVITKLGTAAALAGYAIMLRNPTRGSSRPRRLGAADELVEATESDGCRTRLSLLCGRGLVLFPAC